MEGKLVRILPDGGMREVAESEVNTWINLATGYSAVEKLDLIPSGQVWKYTYGTKVLYRLQPIPYAPDLDAFYTTYSGGVLSGLVIRKTVTV